MICFPSARCHVYVAHAKLVHATSRHPRRRERYRVAASIVVSRRGPQCHARHAYTHTHTHRSPCRGRRGRKVRASLASKSRDAIVAMCLCASVPPCFDPRAAFHLGIAQSRRRHARISLAYKHFSPQSPHAPWPLRCWAPKSALRIIRESGGGFVFQALAAMSTSPMPSSCLQPLAIQGVGQDLSSLPLVSSPVVT